MDPPLQYINGIKEGRPTRILYTVYTSIDTAPVDVVISAIISDQHAKNLILSLVGLSEIALGVRFDFSDEFQKTCRQVRALCM